MFVRLGTEGMYRRTLGCVQHFALNEGLIDVLTHLAAQCVDFTNQMTLTGTADGRIARHHGHGFQVHGAQQSLLTHTGRSQGRFAAGMSGADNDHIVFTH